MRDAKTRHGRYTEETRDMMREVRKLNALARQTLSRL
jgi:hypothetical protein